MSFFDDPRSGGPSSSSRSPVVVKPKIIKTITRVLPPSPSGAKRRVEQLSSPRRDNHPSSAPSKRKSQASSRDTPKRAKVEKKRRRTPTPSSSSSSESGDEVGALNGASTQRTEEDDLAWWSTSLAKRDIFNVNALNGDEETELRWEGFISSRSVVENNLSKYRAYFKQEGFSPDGPLPIVELAYPAPGCREEFILLAPKAANEYDPLQDLMRTTRAIFDTYIPSSHAHLFEAPAESQSQSQPSTPLITHIFSPPSTPRSSRDITPDLASSPGRDSTPTSTGGADEPILRALQRSINRHDGPGFTRALQRFNDTLSLIRSSALKDHLISKSRNVGKKEWETLVAVVGEQIYQRVVGPNTSGLKEYVPFSDNVYGELLPRFMTELINRYRMGPETVFVDLGSGVGNCLVQVALQSGSPSYGGEQMSNPADLATRQIVEARRRWSMWLLRGTDRCEAYECDFCEDVTIAKRLKVADVVLINNYAFSASLNERITLAAFLELKDGAKVISLKPFLQRDFRLTDRNAGSPLAILRMSEHRYPPNSVSWTNEGGVFYEHTIDRSFVRKFYQKQSERGIGRQKRVVEGSD